MASNDALLVEGNDDEHVVYALCDHHHIPEAFKVINKGGITRLLNTLQAELAASDRERLGIIVDANSDLAARWTAIRSILLREGATNLPEKPAPEGVIAEIEQPDRTLTVGIWLMPDNQVPGMLENFVAFLVPEGDALWKYADDCLQQLPESRFPHVQRPKAHVHTWLAWQKEPGKPIGQAITRRYLDAGTPQVDALITWIRRVFAV